MCTKFRKLSSLVVSLYVVPCVGFVEGGGRIGDKKDEG
jgi:hypothetical protein